MWENYEAEVLTSRGPGWISSRGGEALKSGRMRWGGEGNPLCCGGTRPVWAASPGADGGTFPLVGELLLDGVVGLADLLVDVGFQGVLAPSGRGELPAPDFLRVFRGVGSPAWGENCWPLRRGLHDEGGSP